MMETNCRALITWRNNKRDYSSVNSRAGDEWTAIISNVTNKQANPTNYDPADRVKLGVTQDYVRLSKVEYAK